jgi:hypothetical protein
VASGPDEHDAPGLRKARGAFFTPPELCDHIARWAVRGPADRVLEPSCGEAAFLLAAARRLDALGAPRSGLLHGIEVHAASAARARRAVAAAGHRAEVRCDDLFQVTPAPVYDAVVGNPPYVRYQDFAGAARTRSRGAALAAGVRLSALASSWAAFTVHASLFLAPGGRLGLVLPAELLSVNYAAEVRRWLMERFARVRLVLFRDRVFPGVQEEVVLLMAEGDGPTDHCELHQVRDAAELIAREPVPTSWRPHAPGGKWTEALLDDGGLAAYRGAVARPGVTTLQAWGETTLGGVTGNNRFYTLPAERVRALGLRDEDVVPVSPPGSRHLRRLSFGRADLDAVAAAGGATWLFRPAGDPSPAARRYIAGGEAAGVHTAYKCRVRSPWWRTPLPPPADLLLTCMNADHPHLTANDARVHHLNSVHGVYAHEGLGDLARALLPLAALNSLTLLGAEVVGRSYGGGLLKVEPREADALPVPHPDLVRSVAGALAACRPAVERHLGRRGHAAAAVEAVDRIVLPAAGLTAAEIDAVRASRALLHDRRRARARPVVTG